MITCHVRYIIDPHQINAFERYSRSWISVATRMGGGSITATSYRLKEQITSRIASLASPALPTTNSIGKKP